MFISEQETITPEASLMKMWLPVIFESALIVMRSSQPLSAPSRVSACALRLTSSALASMLSRYSLMTKLRPRNTNAMPRIRKLMMTIAAVAVKFLK